MKTKWGGGVGGVERRVSKSLNCCTYGHIQRKKMTQPISVAYVTVCERAAILETVEFVSAKICYEPHV